MTETYPECLTPGVDLSFGVFFLKYIFSAHFYTSVTYILLVPILKNIYSWFCGKTLSQGQKMTEHLYYLCIAFSIRESVSDQYIICTCMNVMLSSFQNQVNELVLGLHDHKSAVLCEFHHMKTVDTSITSSASISSGHASSKNLRKKSISELSNDTCQEEICDYLAPRLLGILGFLDSKLVSSSTMFKWVPFQYLHQPIAPLFDCCHVEFSTDHRLLFIFVF